MLKLKDLKEIKNHILSSENPLFFYDADCDGCCSFLLAYKAAGKGNGVFVKGSPILDINYLNKIEEFSPDKIFVFDKPLISQEFIDKAKIPIVWVDHHSYIDRNSVFYYNPMRYKNPKKMSTTYWIYKSVGGPIWIAALGCVADYHIPDFIAKFEKEYPDLWSKNIKDPGDALFKTQLGYMVKLIGFLFKDKTKKVKENIQLLQQIKSPYEILKGNSVNGSVLLKRALEIEKKYNKILQQALKEKSKKGLLVFTYIDNKHSLTKELSNELLYYNPKKVIIVARFKDDEVVMSLRSRTRPILPVLNKILLQFENAYCGGHELACGATVKKEDYIDFIKKFQSYLGKNYYK